MISIIHCPICAKLATDIAVLMERAETADTTDTDHQAWPEELVRLPYGRIIRLRRYGG